MNFAFAQDAAMATDPPVSEAQRKAMYAALSGHSALGISKAVAKKFVGPGHDRKAKDTATLPNSGLPAVKRVRARDMSPQDWNRLRAALAKFLDEEEQEPEHAEDASPIGAAVVFVAPDGKVLLIKRSQVEGNYKGHWSLPGGKADAGEDAETAAARECLEETGRKPGPLKLINRVKTPLGFDFHTYETTTDSNFVPRINTEHDEFGWFDRSALPTPIHPEVLKVLSKPFAQDRCALDRKSVRSYDADKRLHVSRTPISKATVNEYYGKEIPDYEALGLDAETKYKLWRHPDELKKGAATSNNNPLLSRHVPMDADSHNPDLVVGSLGTDAEFEYPYLYNSLAAYTRDAIDDIESERKQELSMAYRYKADMTPGTTPEGERYDGIMRDIQFNHCAIVQEGRAGKDVCVMDSKPKRYSFGFARTVSFGFDAEPSYERGFKDAKVGKHPAPPSTGGRDQVKDYYEGYRDGLREA